MLKALPKNLHYLSFATKEHFKHSCFTYTQDALTTKQVKKAASEIGWKMHLTLRLTFLTKMRILLNQARQLGKKTTLLFAYLFCVAEFAYFLAKGYQQSPLPSLYYVSYNRTAEVKWKLVYLEWMSQKS